MPNNPTSRNPLNPKRGIILILLAMFCFASMDGMSKYLGQRYDIVGVVMIRMCFLPCL